MSQVECTDTITIVLGALVCYMQIYNNFYIIAISIYSCHHLAQQNPPTMSQLAQIADVYLREDQWLSVAVHLRISYSLCEEHIPENRSNLILNEGRCTGPFLAIAHMWLTRQRGTGELPRTGNTLLKALQKCGFNEIQLNKVCEILMQE